MEKKEYLGLCCVSVKDRLLTQEDAGCRMHVRSDPDVMWSYMHTATFLDLGLNLSG